MSGQTLGLEKRRRGKKRKGEEEREGMGAAQERSLFSMT
jgi:hypothetical protein